MKVELDAASMLNPQPTRQKGERGGNCPCGHLENPKRSGEDLRVNMADENVKLKIPRHARMIAKSGSNTKEIETSAILEFDERPGLIQSALRINGFLPYPLPY